MLYKIRYSPISIGFLVLIGTILCPGINLVFAETKDYFINDFAGTARWARAKATVSSIYPGEAGLSNPAALGNFTEDLLRLDYSCPNKIRDTDPDISAWSFTFTSAGWGYLGNIGFSARGLRQEDDRREEVFTLTYAGKQEFGITGETIAAGVNFNLLNLHEEKENLFSNDREDNNWGIDAGLLYQPNSFVRYGFSGKNLNRPVFEAAERYRLPAYYQLGLSVIPFNNGEFALEFPVDSQKQELEVAASAEVRLLRDSLSLRTGINHQGYGAGLAGSIGKPLGFTLSWEYACFVPYQAEWGETLHSFGLNVRFGPLGKRPIEETTVTAEERAPAPYLVGPNDVLQIIVRNHPELETKAEVDPRGRITFPILGDIEVEGLTELQIQSLLVDYLAPYIELPEVTVKILQYSSQVIYVLGAVRSPGEFPTGGKSLTVRDAVIRAGLPTDAAATWRVYVINPRAGKPAYRIVNLYRILYREDLTYNIRLSPGDVVYVPLTLLGKLSTIIGQILEPFVNVERSGVGVVTNP